MIFLTNVKEYFSLDKLILSKREAAKRLGCRVETVNGLINKGRLKLFVDIPNGFSPRIPTSSLNSYVENNSYTMDQLTNTVKKG